MPLRQFSTTDKLLGELDTALRACLATPGTRRRYPADKAHDDPMSPEERRHAAGLMRINHVGEVCAQALYHGQSLVARSEHTRARLLAAADEEQDHLNWCARRLDELGGRVSLLNPLWYGGAYTIGLGSALLGDHASMSFVVETERQVEAHLGSHLTELPEADRRSRAICEVMREDEASHAEEAGAHGGKPLDPLPAALMRVAAGIMKYVAYRI